MIDPQVCLAQIQRIRPLTFEFNTHLETTQVWYLLANQLLKVAEYLPEGEQQSGRGFLACRLNFRLSGLWFATPLEWKSHHWCRMYWFQEHNQAVLGAEFNLAPIPAPQQAPLRTKIQGRWLMALSSEQEQACRPFLKHLELEWRNIVSSMSSELYALPEIPEHDTFSFLNLHSEQLTQLLKKSADQFSSTGYLDPLLLADHCHMQFGLISDYLSVLIHKMNLNVEAVHNFENTKEHSQVSSLQPDLHLTRWQKNLNSQLQNYRILLIPPQNQIHLLRPQNEIKEQYLVWPGESKRFKQHTKIQWKNPITGQTGKISPQKSRPKQPPLLKLSSKNQPRILATHAEEALFTLKNDTHEMQPFQFISSEPIRHSARTLLAYQSLWPLILPFWKNGERFEHENVILVMLAFSKESSLSPLTLWLEEYMDQLGGAMLEVGTSAVLIMQPNPISLLELSQSIISLERQCKARQIWHQADTLQMAGVKGSCQLTRTGKSIRVLGPAIRQLNKIVSYSQGLDLILDKSLILQSETQKWLAQKHWKLVEIRMSTEPIFQVLSSRR